jgi:hypothetical protein
MKHQNSTIITAMERKDAKSWYVMTPIMKDEEKIMMQQKNPGIQGVKR